MSRPQEERNQEATVYMGNLDDRCSEALLWELMLQAGPVVNVHLPKDRVTQQHQNYGFCEFQSEEDADYAVKIMNMVKLFGKPIRVNKAASDKREIDVGANLFIGNLDPEVDEKVLFDTFSAFGVIVQTPKVGRDMETGAGKGYGFVSFGSFEAADAAIEAMDGQFLANKSVNVSYAFKKDGKGERHGSAAERLLAAQGKKHGAMPTDSQPNRMFAAVPMPDVPGAVGVMPSVHSATASNNVPLGARAGVPDHMPPPVPAGTGTGMGDMSGPVGGYANYPDMAAGGCLRYCV
ncbi:hypothetical protein THASP1DRAFT_16630 [Thamnocephalis sphaerospora]|uniref:Splicing factor 3B subunit 4 n=1 Tax=Thamnocephalis sphaerospora TaxID=78915 RepID=A0A4V1IWJ1_9FUNG|nr:hypothetical protein THASP1DRAFT_16630 [Thamnocephalis sphaerospora]|eukprot:RKP07739.1 hypothetical protein THASP1DRAFT_16630 [Thamnocephalis sphaerospora]